MQTLLLRVITFDEFTRNVKTITKIKRHLAGLKYDKTDDFVDALINMTTVHKMSGRYFGWRGVGFQCAA